MTKPVNPNRVGLEAAAKRRSELDADVAGFLEQNQITHIPKGLSGYVPDTSDGRKKARRKRNISIRANNRTI